LVRKWRGLKTAGLVAAALVLPGGLIALLVVTVVRRLRRRRARAHGVIGRARRMFRRYVSPSYRLLTEL
jgi:hypothetical protein